MICANFSSTLVNTLSTNDRVSHETQNDFKNVSNKNVNKTQVVLSVNLQHFYTAYMYTAAAMFFTEILITNRCH